MCRAGLCWFSRGDNFPETGGTGHVGADHVEYRLRHVRRRQPQEVVKLGTAELDDLRLSVPDMSVYDQDPEE